MTIRDIAAIEADIAETEKEGATVALSYAKTLDLELSAAKAIAKFNKYAAEIAAVEAVASLDKGQLVSFIYGRKTETTEPKLISGTIIAKSTNDKGVVQFNVLIGEGIEAKTVLIGASAVVTEPAAE